MNLMRKEKHRSKPHSSTNAMIPLHIKECANMFIKKGKKIFEAQHAFWNIPEDLNRKNGL